MKARVTKHEEAFSSQNNRISKLKITVAERKEKYEVLCKDHGE